VIRQIERAARLSHDDSSTRRLAKLHALLRLATNQALKVAPVIADLLAIQLGRQQGQLAPRREMDTKRTLEVLVGLLVGLAARKPVLLVAEDAQWIDPTSLELLGRAIDRTKTLSLMVVIIFRPGFVPQWTRSSHVTSLALNGLSRRHAAVLAQHVARGKDLPLEILDRVVAKTSGVPLFVEELTKAAFESGRSIDQHSRASRWDIDLPATLQGALMERLDRLASGKQIAQAAAVIGTEFSADLLAAVTSSADPRLSNALLEIEEAGLIFRRMTAPESIYVFKHALVRDVAYSSLLKRKRRQLHARLVEALEAEQPETEREKWAPRHEYGLLAYHCTEAGLLDKAVRYRRKAAALEVRRNARVEAIAHAAQGLKLLGGVPTSLERQTEALELQGSLADALADLKGCEAPATVDAFGRLCELCREAPAGPQLRTALWLLHCYHFGRAEWDSSRRAAEKILHLARIQDDLGAQAMGYRALGLISFVIGDLLTARAHFDQVLELHVRHNRVVDFKETFRDVHIQAASYLSIVLFTLGYPDAGLQMCKEAVASARQSYWDNAIGPAFSSWCRLQQVLGQWHPVKEAAEEMVSLVDESAAFWRLRAELFQVWVSAIAGDRKVTLDKLHALWAGCQKDISRTPGGGGTSL
jgi:tetratricopeptide (TPR) repeat protein